MREIQTWIRPAEPNEPTAEEDAACPADERTHGRRNGLHPTTDERTHHVRTEQIAPRTNEPTAKSNAIDARGVLCRRSRVSGDVRKRSQRGVLTATLGRAKRTQRLFG